MWELPEGADFVLDRLQAAGYQAYAVGGCVRDTLLGRTPKDWDVCTSALPEQMQQVFADCHVIETGLQHGTLTVMYEHAPFEVTTFRVDGEYTDHRHPDEVIFVADVREDLSRRDFTVNAMAWSPATGLVDAFGGQEDLKRRVIRCVGEPARRFDEDALRIMRALRFASTYGFSIDPETDVAIHALKHTLTGVAAERIRAELAKLLCGPGVGKILRVYRDVFYVIMPQLAPMNGFDQRTQWHCYDVWEHTVRAVESIPPTETLRLTMLLHDAGKPGCFTVDEQGQGHMYGHQHLSAEIAAEVLASLRVDGATRDRVITLVKHHTYQFKAERRAMLRLLSRFGEEVARQLLQIRRADESAKGTRPQAEIDAQISELEAALDEVLSEQLCFSLKDMAVNGRDIMALGCRGKAVGECLNSLLARLLDESLPNERKALLAAARAHIEEGGCI